MTTVLRWDAFRRYRGAARRRCDDRRRGAGASRRLAGGPIHCPPTATSVLDLSDKFVMLDSSMPIVIASIVPGDGDQSGPDAAARVRQAVRAVANLRRDLAAGTTTMRLMAEEHFLDIDLRQAIETGTIPGPATTVCDARHDRSNGHAEPFRRSTGEASTRCGGGRARQNFARGADTSRSLATGGVSSPGLR